jgi:3-hydroxyisobutyrate dehydrogenase-like beta-hydroxyacid dehydrogenase
MLNVGIIGVGLMGHGIARNVVMRGRFPLVFLDHPGNQPVDDLIELGAKSCKTAGEVAASADVVILCVTGSPQVEEVLTRKDGVLGALRRGTVVVDCSTSMPQSTLRMAEAVKNAGGEFVDAPMTRLANQAHEGTLNLLVGGDAVVLAKVRPVLASFTENVAHVGPTGFGHRLKLLHNFVSIGFMALLAEAAAHSADAGVDPTIFIDILAKGGGAGVALERMRPMIISGDASNVPFSIDNAFKDIEYYRAMASGSGASKEIADGVAGAILPAVKEGHGRAYTPELLRFLQRKASST